MATRSWLRRSAAIAGLLLALFVIAFLAGPQVSVAPYEERPLQLPADLDGWLAAEEARVPGLKPGTAKGIVWADPATKAPTPLALVVLHGFSASRGELSPTLERVGQTLKANLYFARLRGHGQTGEALGQATANEWLEDAEEALAIGRRIGQKVVVVGSSTGATLGLWLASRHPDLHAQVMLSPNFGPKDSRAGIILLPWGVEALRVIAGERRTWKPSSEQVARFWTSDYRIDVLGQMMALVDMVNRIDLSEVKTPTLLLYTPKDEILDVSRMPKKFEQIGARRKEMLEVKTATDHVLAGDAISPRSTDEVVDQVTRFLGNL